MIQRDETHAERKYRHLKFTRLSARWQEDADLFETLYIGWGTIQLHHRMVKISQFSLR